MDQDLLITQLSQWTAGLSWSTRLYLAGMAIIALLIAVETAWATLRCRRALHSDWATPNDAFVDEWHRAVSATLCAGSAPTEADTADFFDDVVGYRFERARALAASLMVMGLLGTFVGMAVALQQSSDAMVALQEQFAAPADGTGAPAATEQAELDRLRAEIDQEMTAATSALGSYVEGQQRAIGGMALGVSTSIAGIVLALGLLGFIGLARGPYNRLLRHAHRHTAYWIANTDTGFKSIADGLGNIADDVADATSDALSGLNDDLARSLAGAVLPVVAVLERVEAAVAAQAAALHAMHTANLQIIEVAAHTAHTMQTAAAEQQRSAVESRAQFGAIAGALQTTATEIKEFRDGFEEYIRNSEGLARSYDTAGKRFEVISNALQTIEQNHGALNTALQKLDANVVGAASAFQHVSRQLHDTAQAVVTDIGASVGAVGAASEASAARMSNAVDAAVVRVAQQAGAAGAEAARAVAPVVAREVSRGVLERLQRRNWWGLLLDRLAGRVD